MDHIKLVQFCGLQNSRKLENTSKTTKIRHSSTLLSLQLSNSVLCIVCSPVRVTLGPSTFLALERLKTGRMSRTPACQVQLQVGKAVTSNKKLKQLTVLRWELGEWGWRTFWMPCMYSCSGRQLSIVSFAVLRSASSKQWRSLGGESTQPSQ